MAHVFDGKLYFTRDYIQGNFIPKNLKLPEPKPAPKPRAKASSSSAHVQLFRMVYDRKKGCRCWIMKTAIIRPPQPRHQVPLNLYTHTHCIYIYIYIYIYMCVCVCVFIDVDPQTFREIPSRTFVGFSCLIACGNMGVNLKFKFKFNGSPCTPS